MKIALRRLNVVKIVTKLDVKQCVRVAYIRVTDWSLTTSATTVKGDYRTYQLLWLVATRTGFANHLGIK